MSNQENISKETKKTRRKRSHRTAQQIKLAVIMIMVSVLVLSASTFAWYRMSKIASIQNMQFTADTLGNLLIADAINDGNGDYTEGEYSNSLKLFENDNSALLLPATTEDGKKFYMPDYTDDGSTVEDVIELVDTDLTDNYILDSEGKNNYVYVKEFYIKAGVNVVNDKHYALKLVSSNSEFNSGTYLKDKDGDGDEFDSVNAVRVSLVVNDGSKIAVYEPWNEGNDKDGTYAEIAASVSNQFLSDGELKYESNLISQGDDGVLTDKSGDKLVLCDITEGTPVKITMYVWFEGMDDDCENEIALDTLTGQLQFEAEETTPTP